MSDYSSSQKQKGFELNILGYLVELSKKLWLILILAILAGLFGTIVGRVTSERKYAADITFIVNTLSDDERAESGAISAQINISQTFKRILTSRTLKTAVKESLNDKYTYGTVSSSITVEVVSGTNVITMKVTTDDANKSYEIANAVVAVYGDVLERVYPNARLTVCDEPVMPMGPVANRTPLIMALFSILIVIAVFCIIELIRYIVMDTVKTADELSQKLEIPIIGAIQFIENKNNTAKALLVVDRKTGFSFIETYKAIRTKIESNAAKTGNKVYLVTSACENEGKTTVSANIALSLAENGKRVLLVDADFRNPSIAKILSLPEMEAGFVEVAKGEAAIENAIKLIEKYNLYILAGTKASDNPSELLSAPATEETIQSLRDSFDYIIIDTAPASIVTDASIIAGFSDAAILVVREDFAPMSRIRMSVEDIDQNGAEIVGCIFNGDTSGSIKPKRYGSKYGYGYGKYGRYGRYGGRYGYGKYGYGKYSKYGNTSGYGYGNNKNKSNVSRSKSKH